MESNPQTILLIEPPFYRLYRDTHPFCYYPLSLGYLAGTIKKETKWNVITYNADFCFQRAGWDLRYWLNTGFNNYLNCLKDLSKPIWEEVKSAILEYRPKAVGISTKSQNFRSACIVAKLVKKISKQIIVIVGGPHPSMVGPEVLNCPDIDIAVRGEGENTIVELLNVIDAKNKFDGIKGIIYRKDGQIVENPPREFIEDLDSLCFPHESAPEVLRDYGLYPIWAFGNILAIRGCPYNCLFCGSRKIWSQKVRFRSPANVIREIKELQSRGVLKIHFEDDTFGVTKQYINDLCNAIITQCRGLKWECEMHVKLVDEDTISLMKKAGCILIQLGVESGNNEILQKMRKNYTIEEALLACKIIKKHCVTLQTFFMTGFPQETESTLNDTELAMKKSKADSLAYSIFTPYPGTEAFELCKQNGLIGNGYDVSLYNHLSPANCFCINITPERFRTLASEIERMVDRKNYASWRRKLILSCFSLNTFRKVRELGLVNSFKKAIRIFIGR